MNTKSTADPRLHKIKPCPFCGKNVVFTNIDIGVAHFICEECRYTADFHYYLNDDGNGYTEINRVIDTWNTRKDYRDDRENGTQVADGEDDLLPFKNYANLCY